jgi:ribosomal protein S18 acetylase RimI-like enzyme
MKTYFKNDVCISNKFGYCSYTFIKGIVYIFGLYIYPKYRKKGKASKLLYKIIKDIRSKGYNKEIEIEPSPKEDSISLNELIAFYKSLGLKIYNSNPIDL